MAEQFLTNMSMNALKEICKKHHYKNYSKLRKHELIQFILKKNVVNTSLISSNKPVTRVELIRQCKEHKLKNYSKLRKHELIELLESRTTCGICLEHKQLRQHCTCSFECCEACYERIKNKPCPQCRKESHDNDTFLNDFINEILSLPQNHHTEFLLNMFL
jgi:transcription termination factor Rho